MKNALATACAMLLLASAAQAAAPGQTVLVSRPPGSAPLSRGLFAWNVSGGIEQSDDYYTSQNVTPNGRYVVFTTGADGLAPREDPGFNHVLRKDMQTGALTTVDAGGNGDATDPDISDDGRYVVFSSRASNLAAADTSHDSDVFSKDLQTGNVRLLSPAGTGEDCVGCQVPVISADGATVAFSTQSPMVAGDTNGQYDIYVLPTGGGTPVLASAVPDGSAASNGPSFAPSLSDDGGKVAYRSFGTNLNASNDPTTDPDLYVRDLAGTGSVLASAQNGSNFGVAAGGISSGQISGDGASVVFADNASYLAADGDAQYDVYKRVLASKVDTLISVSTGGTKANANAFDPALDSTGTYVAFVSQATNLGASGGGAHLLVRNVTASTTTPVTEGDAMVGLPAIAHGGDHVVFQSDRALADGPTPGAIHMASLTGTNLTLVSRPPSGAALTPGLTDTHEPSVGQDDRRVSADGRYVVFASDAPALGGPAESTQCWRRDLVTGELLQVSTGDGPVNLCYDPSISADGRRVAFSTTEPLVQADFGGADVYVHDVATGAKSLVTQADGPNGAKADGTPNDAEISADGRHVAFISTATNLGVPAGGAHIYVRNLASGSTKIVDRTTAGAPPPSEASLGAIGIDGDGGRVAFTTSAQLDPGADTDSLRDIYVRDLAAGTTTLVSVQSASDGGAKGNNESRDAAISTDGRRVAFLSQARNLVPALAPWPGPLLFELFVRDIDRGTTTMVSTAPSGSSAGDANVDGFALDATGETVAFDAVKQSSSSSSNVGLDSNRAGILVRKVGASGNLALIQPDAIGGGTSFEQAGATGPALSADACVVSYYARGRNVFTGVSPDFTQLYARGLDGRGCATPSGSGGGAAGGGGGGGLTPARRPVISRASMTRRRFRVGRKRTAVAAKKVKIGTAFRFRLNETANVAIRIDRLAKGRRVKKRCLAPTRARRHRKPCTRASRRGTLSRRVLAAGTRRVAFSGRIGKRKLAAGKYRATLTASASGLRSKPVSLRFTVVR